MTVYIPARSTINAIAIPISIFAAGTWCARGDWLLMVAMLGLAALNVLAVLHQREGQT